MSDFDPAAAIVDSFITNCAITRYLVENVADEAWRAEPPNGKGRTMAAIVAHIHNVRRMWLKAAGGAIPDEADRARITKKDALALLDDSRDALVDVVRKAAASDGRVKGFKPDVAGFVGYHISHEAHHRGQVAMLARQVGHGLEQKVMFAMWEWSNFSPATTAARASRSGSRKSPPKR